MDIKDLFKSRKSVRKFNVNATNADFSEATGAKRDPKKIRIGIVTPRVGAGTAGQFEDSPIDLTEIGRAYYSDSYISRAINKIVGSMFKSGWNFTSLSPAPLEYVQTRFKLIEETTGLSTEDLLRELGLNYVLYGNAPIVKVRDAKAVAGINAIGYLNKKPIAAIFAVAPEKFQIMRDDNGNITGYNVLSEQGQGVEFAPEDFQLMTYHKPTGRAYGIPHISNSIDDVLILRQIEENVARLIYRNIYPLQTYRVGIAEPGMEATEEEILEVQSMLAEAPLDSMIVMPERHNIETVSSNSSMLDAYDYLRYFRQRVFTGLGVSESTMGIGDSSNKSTSDNQSSDLIDLVKDFQQNFTSEFQRLVNEILFEGGFDPTLNKDDRVRFEFTEIEQSARIARENHELQMFMGNGRSIDEFKNNIGDEPVTDFSRYYFSLFAATSEATKNMVDNKDAPANQSGKKDAPPKDSLKDSLSWQNIEKNTNSLLTEGNQRVTLPLDDVNALPVNEKLMISWRHTKTDIIANHDVLKETPMVLSQIIEGHFPNNLFTDTEHHALFVAKLQQGISAKLGRADNKTSEELGDMFYLYENSVVACYEHSLEFDKEGGIEWIS